ncbi:hypothetical protein AVEN_190941-1 [Araneus ventricosus]|uniref:Uncharacterized protein n=1 Tax=Araneus ventricosus TaxID=182803 RepID=A0A4Y2JGM2_ARAVE|nr:hypothetical protein AVEN_190941-1 [Araneus ventricosus]
MRPPVFDVFITTKDRRLSLPRIILPRILTDTPVGPYSTEIDKLEQAYSTFEFADSKLPIEKSETDELEEEYLETRTNLQTNLENVNMPMQMNNADSAVSVNNIFKACKSSDSHSFNSSWIKCPKSWGNHQLERCFRYQKLNPY